MGTLEELRDVVTDLVRDEIPLDLADMNLRRWHDAGCPGYEPAAFGAYGDVPTEDGVYVFQFRGRRSQNVAMRRNGMWLSLGFTTKRHHDDIVEVGADVRFRRIADVPLDVEADDGNA